SPKPWDCGDAGEEYRHFETRFEALRSVGCGAGRSGDQYVGLSPARRTAEEGVGVGCYRSVWAVVFGISADAGFAGEPGDESDSRTAAAGAGAGRVTWAALALPASACAEQKLAKQGRSPAPQSSTATT